MSSTFGGLNTVVRGLYAQQASLDTVGHNVTNANTEGYSRQNVNLGTTNPQALFGANGENQLGTGVNIESIMRARDTFVDRQMWKETSSLGYGQATVENLSRIEGVFHEPSTTGIQTVLNKLWSSFQTLATNASDNGMRTEVRQRLGNVSNALNQTSQQLTEMIADTNAVVDIKVDNINQITAGIYSLNKQIVNIETGGLDHANDLRDKRDLLVDQISKIINIHLTEDKVGNYTIQSMGIPLVDGAGVTKLTTKPTTNDPDYGYEVRNVMAEGSTQPINFSNGELKGLIESRDSTVFGAKAYLDKINVVSKFLLQDFNNINKAGYGTDNSTGNNLFGDPSIDYNTWTPPAGSLGWITQMKVSVAVLSPTDGLSKIAAKTSLDNLTIRQSNALGGSPTVNSTYTGVTPQNYIVKIDTMASAMGDVTSVSYSTNNGVSWATAPEVTTPVTVPKTFQLLAGALGALTIKIGNDADSKTGDTYTFYSNQGNASGDNAVKLANGLKVDVSSTTLGGSSLDTYYSSVIGALGVQVQDAKRLTDNQTTLVNQVKNWRESTSGVNIDEEMTNMIRFQKGYAAAARVLTSMDEMLDKLINSTGVVGR
jgi:flagellar hook-associated protein 1 FlgK